MIYSETSVEEEQLQEILTGLSQKQKQLPSKYFYDAEGSKFFDQICELDEYYPTRTELRIMEDNIEEIVSVFRENSLFIEFGSGSSLKTKLILEKVKKIAGYIPLDISESHLNNSAERLRDMFPNLNIIPIAADYTKPIEFPLIKEGADHRVMYFPGSTRGNFAPEDASEFLAMVAREAEPGGGLIIGIDMVKDVKVLEAAYDDSKGITAKFNLNILKNINNIFHSNFDVSRFEHRAIFNNEFNRIEMHLLSKEKQNFTIGGREFELKMGETILTEYSHKYTLESFRRICGDSYRIEKVWSDEQNYFSIVYLSVV